jgi:hypothetical protein
MPTERAYDKFVPISITSVPDGWRCIFTETDKGIVKDVLPMAGWAIWKASVVDPGGKTLIEDVDPFVEAIVIVGGPMCARDLESSGLALFGYLLPGQEAPKVGEFLPSPDPERKGKGDKPFKRTGRPGQGRQAPS